MEKLNDANIIFERGMHLVELKDTPIPTTVTQRGWRNFVSVPADANVSLVKEFYASIIPEAVKEGRPVLVRDILVMINPTKINAHFCTSDYPQFNKGYRSMHNTKSSLAMALRGTDDEEEDQDYKDPASQSMLAKILSAVEGIQLGMTGLEDSLQAIVACFVPLGLCLLKPHHMACTHLARLYSVPVKRVARLKCLGH
ncbi:hypothetical protein Ddye_014962 [Dipteronia dyeriana]|uniref:Uncharacterized protein n=1 Tax=Dipteronia dyeriana TaxID=168575 RepID=A0AAD9U4M9_9ROSI|nr:hypothetical protein Ddye_014962 [Dipteronia dyeriana]